MDKLTHHFDLLMTNKANLASMEITNLRAYRAYITNRSGAVGGQEQAAKMTRKGKIFASNKITKRSTNYVPEVIDGVKPLSPISIKTITLMMSRRLKRQTGNLA